MSNDRVRDGWEDDHLWELQLRIYKSGKFNPLAFESYRDMINYYESQNIDVDFHKKILNIYKGRYDVERANREFKERIFRLRRNNNE